MWEDDPKDYNYTKLRVDNNKTVYCTNQAIGEKVLTEVKLSEGSVCIHPGEINHQFNLKQYILDKEYFNNNCLTNIAGTKWDPRFKIVNSVKKLIYNLKMGYFLI